ncbi:hypothetical protein AM593_00391, partial [Mytilus galloprovincialis]
CLFSTEFKSNGSETIITKAPVIIPENETDVSPNTPVKETANITKTGLKWSFIAMAAKRCSETAFPRQLN